MTTFEVPCTSCLRGTTQVCDACDKPHCSVYAGCLFKTGQLLTLPTDPRDEDYQEHPTWQREEVLCLTCYLTRTGGTPPLVLWEGTSAVMRFLYQPLQKGSLIPAGDDHFWYAAPSSGDVAILRWGDHEVPLDVFRALQLLTLLKAHEARIRTQAESVSAILIEEAHRVHRAALKADAGITHNHWYDEEGE